MRFIGITPWSTSIYKSVDGTRYKELYTMTKECGIDIKQTYGDKAYFRKSILDILAEDLSV